MSTSEPESTPESSLIRALSARFEIDSERESHMEAACRGQANPISAHLPLPRRLAFLPFRLWSVEVKVRYQGRVMLFPISRSIGALLLGGASFICGMILKARWSSLIGVRGGRKTEIRGTKSTSLERRHIQPINSLKSVFSLHHRT